MCISGAVIHPKVDGSEPRLFLPAEHSSCFVIRLELASAHAAYRKKLRSGMGYDVETLLSASPQSLATAAITPQQSQQLLSREVVLHTLRESGPPPSPPGRAQARRTTFSSRRSAFQVAARTRGCAYASQPNLNPAHRLCEID